MRLKKLELEKVNMKVVVIIGVSVIVILTAMLIIFKTNLIFDNDDKEEGNKTTENQGGTSNNNGDKDNDSDNDNEDNDGDENPVDPNNPDGDDDSSGNGSSNNGKDEDPDYSDYDEDDVSDEAKDRTKKKDKLTTAEKIYIFEDNMKKWTKENEFLKETCEKIGPYIDNCKESVTKHNQYQDEKDKIVDCTGDIWYVYNPETKKYEYDLSEIECVE